MGSVVFRRSLKKQAQNCTVRWRKRDCLEEMFLVITFSSEELVYIQTVIDSKIVRSQTPAALNA